MARKVVNRKERRAEIEAAEQAEGTKTKPKRKSRAKSQAETRMKLFWGVFNQSLKRVALYEFHQLKQAQKRAEELTESAKTPHFVQRVKESVAP